MGKVQTFDTISNKFNVYRLCKLVIASQNNVRVARMTYRLWDVRLWVLLGTAYCCLTDFEHSNLKFSAFRSSVPTNYKERLFLKVVDTYSFVSKFVRRALEVGLFARIPPPSPSPSKWKCLKHRFCRRDNIKRFKRFTLLPKPAIEIGWWVIHQNFGKQD